MASPNEWMQLQAPPSNAAALLEISEQKSNPMSSVASVRHFWFEASNDHLMLCRVVVAFGETVPSSDCGAVSWEFEHSGNVWRLLPNGGERFIFCH
jgi:hypothetical protein